MNSTLAPSPNQKPLLFDDPVFDEHHARGDHPECPERLQAARRAVERTRPQLEFTQVPARDATEEELARVHTPEYLQQLDQLAGQWSFIDADTYVCPASIGAAKRAAGATVQLVEGLLSGMAPWGLALVRPPGHHACANRAMGFCLLNNVAVAAAHARALGAERVLVLDIDVHHGNGTQEIFYRDPSVLYVSLHQFPYYPGTGAATELGEGRGRGYTVNVPLSGGAGDTTYRTAFERIVLPIIEEYHPSLTLVSAGFDAHERDPLGGMMLSDAGYSSLIQRLKSSLPARHPIGLVLEGGYDFIGLQTALEHTLLSMASPRVTPSLQALQTPASPGLGSHQRDLERAEAVQRVHWYLG
ncbi:MAG TPA: histone deacetylase [Polyangiaceae bacterium]|nr:histone deacetylase [Polyangiaceae bacterium]